MFNTNYESGINDLWHNPEMVKSFRIDDVFDNLPIGLVSDFSWMKDKDVSYEYCYMDIPGCSKENTTVDVAGKVIKVAATRTYPSGFKQVYDKNIKLPYYLDSSTVEAKLLDGVLTIRAKKKATQMESAKRVSIS